MKGFQTVLSVPDYSLAFWCDLTFMILEEGKQLSAMGIQTMILNSCASAVKTAPTSRIPTPADSNPVLMHFDLKTGGKQHLLAFTGNGTYSIIHLLEAVP